MASFSDTRRHVQNRSLSDVLTLRSNGTFDSVPKLNRQGRIGWQPTFVRSWAAIVFLEIPEPSHVASFRCFLRVDIPVTFYPASAGSCFRNCRRVESREH